MSDLDDQILSEMIEFQRRLDGLIRDERQERKPPPFTTDRWTTFAPTPHRANQRDDEDEDVPVSRAQVVTCPISGEVTVEVDGIASCGCKGIDTYSYNMDSASGMNGTHALAWDSDTSSFRVEDVGSFVVHQYSSGDCSGAYVGSGNGTFTIIASCSGGKWSVTVDAVFAAEISGENPFGSSVTVFSTATPRSKGVAIDNANDCGETTTLAAGGTATVTA